MTGLFNGVVNLYDSEFNLKHSMKAHEGVVNDAQFSNHGSIRTLATCSDDEILKLFSINEKGNLVQYGQLNNQANSLSFCPTNTSLLSFSGDNGELNIASISKA